MLLCETRTLRVARCAVFLLVLAGQSLCLAQDPADTRPVVGLRENPPDTVFLKDGRVVIRPGQVIPSASILIRGKSIVAVGSDIQPPPGAHVIDCSDKSIYAGLIDAFGEIAVAPPQSNGTGHWNGYVLPRRSAADGIDEVSNISEYRSQGVAMRLLAPRGAIVKGRSSLVMLDKKSGATLIDDAVAQHLQLTVPRDRRRDAYPNSPMGAVALLRQTFSDADWYTKAWEAYRSKPTLPRPERNDALATLADEMRGGRFIADAPNERMAVRAEELANEFALNMTLRGSGREYRDLDAIAASGRMLLVPVNFPSAPDVSSEAQAADIELRDLLHWHFAPENPLRLDQAGATFCLTSDGLSDPKSFLKNIRVAVRRGLSPDVALAALTTTPAKWLGIDETCGAIQVGGLANLIVTDGELFEEETHVLETWVAGKRFEFSDNAPEQPDRLIGDWTTKIKIDAKGVPVELHLARKKGKWSGNLTYRGKAKPSAAEVEKADAESDAEPAADKSKKESKSAGLKKIARALDRMTAWVDLSQADSKLPAGPSRITMITVEEEDSISVFSTLSLPDGKTQDLKWKRAKQKKTTPDTKTADDEGDDGEKSDNGSEPVSEDASPLDAITVNYPLGGFGVTDSVPVEPMVLFRNATVWTCGDQGVLNHADVLVIDGKIDSVGNALEVPEGCRVVDATGKHLSPGLIDCHSHMGTDGGINESGQAVTAEVRVADFIDNSDINIYRQLAGGVTSSNILHGSANPIGGQNQVIKLRWGDSMQAMKMASAPAGIKFALGENVKQSNRSAAQTRYPSSRMGVEQLFRDRFQAAKDYSQQQRRWQAGQRDGLPLRRDFELEAIVEILNGQRWIHCHSYRQDEIVAFLDLLDQFDITIGTLQHVLEGYKVADRLREHGAMASAFSDWWAYKFEVYDAVPYNGAIMHDEGIVVSFNSDDRELARHLNTEAAKAVKYGGVSEEEALKFVTLNPAKQLRIDDRVGSITLGKDADLVLWSGPPLSTLSRCEQTWVDGRPMFTLENDQRLRQRDAEWRSMLIARILDKNYGSGGSDKKEIEEEDRWLRFDEYCHGHDDHDHAHHNHDHNDSGHRHAEARR
ncbi:amidohydrolase family protein [Rosistilla oblonga]|uniref:amidohydrolase family protein n=1 Tax=Rosistilla oblonga TaxID=2527990 RepID=UPI003A97FF2E